MTFKIEMNNLMEFKKDIFEKTGLKVSISDFIIKASSLACIKVP